MTRRGRSLGALGGAGLIIGIGAGYAALAFVGLLLLALVGLAVAWTARTMAYAAERQLSATRVGLGEPVTARLRVTNRAGRRSAAAVGHEVVGQGSVPVPVPRLLAGQTVDLEYAVPTTRRGVQPVGPTTFVLRDPFGLCERTRVVPGFLEVFVRPHTHALGLPSRGRVRAMDEGEADRAIEGSLTFHALREYLPGDDRRRIHWRTSARTGTLMVKEHIDMTRPEVLIALDVHAEAGDDFEELVEFAASAGAASLRNGHPVRLITSNGVEEMFDGHGSEARLLDALTVVQACGAGADSAWLAAAAARSSGSTAFVCSVDSEIAAAAGQAMFAGRFGTVACVSISDASQVAQLGSMQVFAAPSATDLVSQWNARFVA